MAAFDACYALGFRLLGGGVVPATHVGVPPRLATSRPPRLCVRYEAADSPWTPWHGAVGSIFLISTPCTSSRILRYLGTYHPV